MSAISSCCQKQNVPLRSPPQNAASEKVTSLAVTVGIIGLAALGTLTCFLLLPWTLALPIIATSLAMTLAELAIFSEKPLSSEKKTGVAALGALALLTDILLLPWHLTLAIVGANLVIDAATTIILSSCSKKIRDPFIS